MQATFIDLDELILLCRDESAKRFIQEAVACYRAGAYRSCIVSTWNAVVFDFIHKLRELQLMGNGEAVKFLDSFDKKRKTKDVKGLWRFESDIPENARAKFDLISHIEQEDIARLLQDRNRCAHPSVISLDEPFEATAELARYHMRSAVTHLLQRPPVQGRQALERVRQDVNSDYFPDDLQLAIKYLNAGPLEKPRATLVNDIVYELSDKLLREDISEKKLAQLYTAIRAIIEMHREHIEKFLNAGLPKIFSQTNDDQWHKVVRYLREVAVAQNLDEPYRSKTSTFIKEIVVYSDRIKVQAFIDASYVDFLRDIVADNLRNICLIKILNLGVENFSSDMQTIMESFWDTKIEEFVEDFVGASSYASANTHAEVWPEIFDDMNSQHHKKLLDAFLENGEISGSHGFPRAALEIFEKQKKLEQTMPSYWKEFRKKLDNVDNYNMDALKKSIDSYSCELELH